VSEHPFPSSSPSSLSYPYRECDSSAITVLIGAMTLAIKEAYDRSEKRLYIHVAQRCLLRVDWAAEGLWTDDTMEQVFHKNHIQPEVLMSTAE
jgi:hypothetical protein